MVILLIIFLFLLSNDDSWNSFFHKKESIKYLLLFFFIYLIYYQFNISLLILPLLTLHFMSQPAFRKKVFENPIWEKMKNQIQMFTENKVISVKEENLVFEEKQEINPKEEKDLKENIIEYPEIIEIHDDTEATQIQRNKNQEFSQRVEKQSTELTYQELEELYSSLNQQLKEFEK